jgi:cell division protein FtsI (penicillin-binding protein 3)
MTDSKPSETYPIRRWLLLGFYMAGMSMLIWRSVDLQVLNKEFLQEHGDARAVRVVEIPAHRGMITDRNGEPLAISTPVNSVWATPHKVLMSAIDLAPLANLLEMNVEELEILLKDRFGRDFVYLKRHVDPVLSEKIAALDIPGISFQQEYRRYYPTGEVASHLIGFTNIDDIGQEGLELAYDEWLRGTPGSKRVLKDRLGRIVANIESIRPAKSGRVLELSIDRRIQYLAYREMKSAVNLHRARAGSLVMLDAKTGEVMALVGQPSYNPNNRNGLRSGFFRNRAITDAFEPGSTLKPFTIVTALQSGFYSPVTPVDTRPGYIKVGNHTIRDISNYGVIDLASVIKKSSNVGATKIALSLEPEMLWETLNNFGFGKITGSGFPGETAGRLDIPDNWSEVELATIAFGYGLSVTVLQLAQAYLVLANTGNLLPLSFHKITEPVNGHRVLPEKVSAQVLDMLEAVVQKGGTGYRAAVNGYRVAGKTGTVHKSKAGGYSEDRYLSLFAGMAPVSNPRLVMVVMIDEPRGGQHYGGQVAAPVFSRVMSGALRLLNVSPDDLPMPPGQIVAGKNMAQELIE